MYPRDKFKIGDFVEAIPVEFIYKGNNKVIDKKRNKITGQIVGATWRSTGKYYQGYGAFGYEDGYDYDSPYLEIAETFLVWKIRQGVMNRSVEALTEDIEKVSNIKEIPWKYRERVLR